MDWWFEDAGDALSHQSGYRDTGRWAAAGWAKLAGVCTTIGIVTRAGRQVTDRQWGIKAAQSRKRVIGEDNRLKWVGLGLGGYKKEC